MHKHLAQGIIGILCTDSRMWYVLQARGYLQSLPPKIKVPWNKLYPSADPKGWHRPHCLKRC